MVSDDTDPEQADEPATGGMDSDVESGEAAVDTDDSGSGGETADGDQSAGRASANAGADGDQSADGAAQAETVETAEPAETAETVDASGEGAAEVEVTRESGSVLAAVVSFFIPGVGNMINGDTDRGVVILALFIAWTVLAWGVGFFLIGSIITVLTLGLGIIVQGLIALVILPIDLAIHVLAAVDAYRGSEIVDRVTVKVDELR